jgi:hypothetical protein
MKLPFQQNVKKTFCFKPQVCVCYEDEAVLPNDVLLNMNVIIQNSRISSNMKVLRFTERSLHVKVEMKVLLRVGECCCMWGSVAA